MPQVREDAGDILPISRECGFRQFVGCDLQEPELDVLFQGDIFFDRVGSVFALQLEEHRLLLQPFFSLLFGQPLRRLDCFLPGFSALAVVVVAHGYHQKVAVAALSDACHDVDLLSVDLSTAEAYLGKHNIPEPVEKSYCYFCSDDKFYRIDSYTAVPLAQLPGVSKRLWVSWFAASCFSRICGWQ